MSHINKMVNSQIKTKKRKKKKKIVLENSTKCNTDKNTVMEQKIQKIAQTYVN